jgi:predicted dehydrogenase
MLDLGIHRLDLALHFLGFPPVLSVTGVSFFGIGAQEGERRGKRYEIEDGAVGFVRFAGGSALQVGASYFQSSPEEGQNTILFGDRGSVDTAAEPAVMTYETGKPVPVDVRPDETVARSSVEHFVRVVRGDEPLGPTAEQGRLGLWIVRSIYESAATGRAVAFPQTQ